MRLQGKAALITGASRGLGKAVALRLAQEGARVALNYRTQDAAAREVAELIRQDGGTAVTIQADVSQAQDVARLVEEASQALGGLDILVNNAGINRDGLLLRMSDADWDDVIATNLRGTFLCSRAALRGMIRQRWGRIITMSSVVGLVGNPGQANYAAAKAGLIGFTKSLAREVGSRGVTVNAVAPGFIAVGMTETLSDELKQAYLGRIALGHFGTAEDVAAAVAFLASDEAAYITGQVLSVDGGLG